MQTILISSRTLGASELFSIFSTFFFSCCLFSCCCCFFGRPFPFSVSSYCPPMPFACLLSHPLWSSCSLSWLFHLCTVDLILASPDAPFRGGWVGGSGGRVEVGDSGLWCHVLASFFFFFGVNLNWRQERRKMEISATKFWTMFELIVFYIFLRFSKNREIISWFLFPLLSHILFMKLARRYY